jgi:antitoxin (DNA-binding transcriptional repressor) of toxin-antitoxin stability system
MAEAGTVVAMAEAGTVVAMAEAGTVVADLVPRMSAALAWAVALASIV